MAEKRSSFSGKLGFVLATAGSAVGLGNIWRFPYLAAQYGGGIFLLVYIILALTFGFALMCAEIAIGRKTGVSAIGAYKKLDKRFSFLGLLTSLVPIIILPYYSVIGGWIIKYLVQFVSGGMAQAATDGFFDNFISIALPRVRDFRGVSKKSFDGRGNYSMGVKEQLIFPEISYDQVEKVRGFDICITTTANTDEEARELLAQLGMPFATK